MPTNPIRLPLIPLSPLTQASIESAKCLSKITQNLSEIPDDALLQKYHDSSQERLDQMTRSIQSIQSSTLADFDPQDIAKEIAYINTQLFRLVVLDATLLKNFDKQVNAIPLLDFQRFLSHAFAHEIISGTQNNIIHQLIQIASTLLFVYRDFSGCTAILECLQMPEVQRIETTWNQCPPKMINAFKSLLSLLSPERDYEDYVNTLGSLTLPYLSAKPGGMVAIPYLYAHLLMVHQVPSTLQILQFCQQRIPIEAFSQKTMQGAIRRADLDQLQSDPSVYHWIVSRTYLTRPQLYYESLQNVPLAPGEILLEGKEKNDLFWEFYGIEEEIESPKVSQKSFDGGEGSQLWVPVERAEESSSGELETISEEEHYEIVDEADAYEVPESSSSVVVEQKVDNLRKEYTPNLNFDDTDSEKDDVVPEIKRSELKVVESEIKPTLSATAAEFVPTTSLKAPEEEEYEEEWTGYPVKEEEEEEEDEEWKGYPIGNIEEQENEDEEDEEVWKGYPVPVSAIKEHIPSFEPWDKAGMPQPFGKTAVGHIQHSVSSNIVTSTGKKKFPSLFVSTSSST
ncbi:unnamed protein product [Rhizopus stolonifer]